MNIDFAVRMTNFRCVEEKGVKVLYFDICYPKKKLYQLQFSMDIAEDMESLGIDMSRELDQVIKSEMICLYADNINFVVGNINRFFDIKYELGKRINSESLLEVGYIKNAKCRARFENMDDLAKILGVSCIEEAFMRLDLLGMDTENMRLEIGKMTNDVR